MASTRMLRERRSSAIPAIVGAVVAILTVYPILRVVGRLFWEDGRPSVSPITETLRAPGLAGVVVNTLVIVTASTILALAVGGVLAWLNERTDARLGFVTDSLPLVNFLLPAIAGAIGWVFLLSPRAGYLNGVLRRLLGGVGVHLDEGPFTVFSWYGILLAYTSNLVPYAFLMISAGLRQLDPSLEEQARVSGSGLFKTLRTVTLPALRPSLGAAAFLSVWAGLGMFSVPVIIANGAGVEVLSVRIVRALTFDYPPETAIAVGLGSFTMAALAVMWYAQRRVFRLGRFATVSGKQRRAERIPLGRWRLVARVLMLAYLVGTVLLPFGALLIVSLNGYWTLDVSWGELSLDAFRRAILDDPVTWRAFTNSLRLAFVVATVGTIAAAIISEWVVRSRTNFSRGVDIAIKFPAAMPSVIIATGFLLAFNGPPFGLGGTMLLLVLAYLILSMPEATVVADSAAALVGKELSEASSICGAPSSRTFRRIQLPLMLSGLVAGWALLFVRTIGDVNASVILATTRNTVVGFRILQIYDSGSYAQLGMMAATLTVLSMLVILLVFVLARRLSSWQRSAS